MKDISQRQLEILRHAIGWPRNYRNYFCTSEGSDDFADCELLVDAGMMTRHKKDCIPDNVYIVTEAGFLLLTELSDEAKLAVRLARKAAKEQEDILRSEIDDVRRERDRCVDALREIYTDYGEDPRIADICDPLIAEFSCSA